jgi:hypothetical protein
VMDGPCVSPMIPNGVHYLIAILSAVNIALNTWLVNRRARADNREQQRNSRRISQKSIDSGCPLDASDDRRGSRARHK